MNTIYSRLKNYYYIIIAISLGSIYWLVDSYLDALASGNALSTELYNQNVHMVYEWLTVTFLFISFGVYARHIITKQKFIEEELQRTIILVREEKAKTDSIIASIGDPVSIQDVNFKVLYQNKIHQDIVGDQKGKYCYREYEHRDQICEGCPVNMSFKDGKIHTLERNIIKDGQKLYFEITASPLRDSTGKIIAGIEVARDITKRKLAELEYKTILQTAMDGFFVVDLQGNILDVNDACCSMVGYSRDELINMRVSDIEVNHTEEMIAERIQKILKIGWDRFETRHKCKDGRIVEIEASVNYMGIGNGRFFAFTRDITERKREQAKLTDANNYVSKIIKSSYDSIIVVDKEGRFEFGNEAFYRILGYPENEIIGQVFMKVIHPDYHDFILQRWNDVQRGEGRPYEVDIVRKDGKVRNLFVSPTDMEIDGKRKYCVIAKDITERKQAEKTMFEQAKILESFFKHTINPIVFLDRDFNFVRVNEVYAMECQRDISEFIGRNHFELYPSDARAIFEHVVETRTSYRVNAHPFSFPDHPEWGITYWDWSLTPLLDQTGEVEILVFSLNNVTESKQMGKALQDSEMKYRNIVETANEGIWILDASSKTSFVNSRMAQMLGYTTEEMLGRHLFDFIGTDARTEAEKNLERRKQGIIETHDFRFSRKDGTNLWAIVSTNPIFDDKGQYVGTLGMISDISKRKEAEEQIKASLKEKEVLLREIHHRVKNNMQIISSLLNLQAGYIEDTKYLEMFKESQNRIYTMSLVHENLYMSKDITKINFKDYIHNLANGVFQSYSSRSGNILLNLNIDDVELGIDTAIPCGLIINELVTNSIKYAFPDEKNGEIKINLGKIDENEYELTVSDNGIGIPEDQDFRKTKTLGLYLVSMLAEDQLSGKIKLDRSKGTEFRIRFGEGK